MIRLKTIAIAFVGCIGALLAAPASAQTPLFSDDSVIAFTIEGPLNTIVRNSARNTDAHPATLTLTAGGPERAYPIQLSARGLTRRQSRICAFPPLRLDFGDGLRGTFFAGQNKVKLVTHCRPGEANAQYVALEYVVYQLYNAVTPQSFRVRAARITYRDSEGRRAPETHFGFLIEDVDDLARRNGLREIDLERASVAQLDSGAAARAALFQYMIGNLDWSFLSGPPGDGCCHNARVIGQRDATSGLIPTPYDFDFSGFVGAHYATPPDGLRIRNVRTRVYRGHCAYNAAVPAAAAHFISRRAAIMAAVNGDPRLNDENKCNATRYLEQFFEAIATPEGVARITRACLS